MEQTRPSVGRVRSLVDYKSSDFKAFEHRLQLGAYWGCPYAYDKATHQSTLTPPADEGQVLCVNQRGVKVVTHMTHEELAEGFARFQDCLRVFRYMQAEGWAGIPKARYVIGNTDYISVTQVLQTVVAKPGLLQWYAKMGREGKDPLAVRNEAAARGSTMHKNVLFLLQGKPVDLTHAPPDLAETMIKFSAWVDQHEVNPICLEQTVYHPELGYAGTLDAVLEYAIHLTPVPTTEVLHESIG